MARERARQDGFTLVEMAVVLIVVGILLAITTPALRRYLSSYRVGDAARQIQSEMRLARQKAVTNGTRNWIFCGTSGNEVYYWTGIQTQRSDLSWSAVNWIQWNMPQNTKLIAPTFNGTNWFYYGPDGKPTQGSTVPVSGSVRVGSTNPSVSDTATVNVDLTGEVWQ
jgi:prepilin-type N-terminal cleavage/methylation domain-containing protein